MPAKLTSSSTGSAATKSPPLSDLSMFGLAPAILSRPIY
jgi:hypothetical protein